MAEHKPDQGVPQPSPLAEGAAAVSGVDDKFIVVHRYKPRVRVVIRGRYLDTSGEKEVNFSDSAGGDLLQVSTHKDIGETTGSFTLTLTARRDKKGRSWQHKIGSMDYVEIYFSHDSSEPKIVMRGFVNTVNKQWTIVNNRPQFAIIVQGSDYGKLMVRCNLFLVDVAGMPITGSDIDALYGGSGHSALQIFFEERWNITGQQGADPTGGSPYSLLPSEFIDAIVDQKNGILGAYILFSDCPQITNGTRAQDFPDGMIIFLQTSTAVLGSTQNLLDAFSAKLWYEQYIRDDDLGPTLVWRLAPYMTDTEDKYIQLGSVEPEHPAKHLIPYKEVINDQTGRQDTDQYSYYMTIPEALGGVDFPTRREFGEPEPAGAAVWRIDLSKQFGFRPMELIFPLYPITATGTSTDTNVLKDAFLGPTRDLNEWLDKAFSDQYIFEQGTIDVLGRPEYRVGEYVKFTTDGRIFYTEAVDHSFNVDPIGYGTKLTVTRGRWPKGKSPYRTMTPQYSGNDVTNYGYDEPIESVLQPPDQTTNGGSASNSDPKNNPGSAPPSTAPAPIDPSGWTCPIHNLTRTNNPFGPNNEPLDHFFHFGVDWPAPVGTPVFAAHSGTIQFTGYTGDPLDSNNAGPNTGTGLGLHIDIDVGGGVTIMYGHLSQVAVANAHVGQQVTAGQTIGYVGTTGASTGPHLHFQVDVNGVPVNPTQYLPSSCGAS